MAFNRFWISSWDENSHNTTTFLPIKFMKCLEFYAPTLQILLRLLDNLKWQVVCLVRQHGDEKMFGMKVYEAFAKELHGPLVREFILNLTQTRRPAY